MARSRRRAASPRGAAAVLAAAVAGAVVVLGAPTAYADTVDVDYGCKTPIGNKGAVSPIKMTGAKSGSGYKITVSFEKGVSSSPIELGPGTAKPSARIKLGGADSGTMTVAGPANDKAIPAKTPIKLSTMTGTYTPRKTGTVTFTPDVLTISALGTTTTCTPRNNPKPGLTLAVTASGGAAGGSASAGGSESAATGGSSLPQTGPADSAVALGTFGGTVLLLGVGGGLWLSRRSGRTR